MEYNTKVTVTGTVERKIELGTGIAMLLNCNQYYSKLDGEPACKKLYVPVQFEAEIAQNIVDANPSIGDKLTGFVGMVSSAFGVTSFIPMAPTLGVVVSEGNEAAPVVATLSEIKAAPADYLNRLVRIENASLSGFAEGATFAEGMAQPTITDATGEGKLRIFSGTSLIGTTALNLCLCHHNWPAQCLRHRAGCHGRTVVHRITRQV